MWKVRKISLHFYNNLIIFKQLMTNIPHFPHGFPHSFQQNNFVKQIPITKIIDTVDSDYKFGDIPPMDKILDKADFVTIRAGKIQDQIKGGKGKGLKRDNIITNIIRSYTKSEW